MKNKSHIILSVVLAGCLLAGTGIYALAENTNTTSPSDLTSAADELVSSLDGVIDTTPANKEETVYIIAGADGATQKVIVSNWVKNPDSNSSLTDHTDASDVEALKSGLSYTINGEGNYVWDTAGKDVYYQGTSENPLPVSMTISYLLDGKEISADDLAGKSGKLTIRFNYINQQYELVSIDGKQEKMYVPFVMLTGMMLNNTQCRNITVSNGKIINDGDRSFVIGFALPGLQEDLGLDAEKLQLPKSLEVNADVTDFKLETTLTFATNEPFNTLNLDKIQSADELKTSLTTLTDAVTQLTDGSSALYNGISTLLDKSDVLISGVKELCDGAKQINDNLDKLANGAEALHKGTTELVSGAETLANGNAALKDAANQLKDGSQDLASGAAQVASGAEQVDAAANQLAGYTQNIAENLDKLNQGAANLQSGLTQLDGKSAELVEGVKQVFDTLLATTTAQIRAAGLTIDTLTVSNYAAVLKKAISSLDEATVKAAATQIALQSVTSSVNANLTTIQASVTQAVQEKVLEGVLATLGMTPAQYEQAVSAGAVSAAQQTQINAAVANQMATAEIQSTIKTNTDKQVEKLIADNMASAAVQSQITAAVEQAKAGKSSLQSALDQLNSYNTFYQGILQYTAGVKNASEGNAQISSALSQLAPGAEQVASGMDSLTAGTNDLKDGASIVANGSETIASNMKDFSAGATQAASGAADLAAGANKLSDASGTLADGSSQLKTGMQKLYDGLLSLQDQLPLLKDGVTQLQDGALQLSDGMKQFSDQGLSLLTAFGDDLDSIAVRLKAVSDVSKNYNSYSGITDGTTGSVKFIYRTSSIG